MLRRALIRERRITVRSVKIVVLHRRLYWWPHVLSCVVVRGTREAAYPASSAVGVLLARLGWCLSMRPRRHLMLAAALVARRRVVHLVAHTIHLLLLVVILVLAASILVVAHVRRPVVLVLLRLHEA